jgi:RNA polymerase sigma-70 factor (ECF subfamily)
MSDTQEQPGRAEEAALIEKAQRGDQAAMETLLSSHQDRVYRTVLGLVGGNAEAAFEIAQEVLVSAYRHIGQFRGASKFSTWLYRMAVNYTKNHKVARGRRDARFVSMDAPRRNDSSGDEVPMDFAAEQVSAREHAAGAEMLDLLKERLGELDPDFRTVIVLRYLEDRSYEEIAEALGIPEGTVKSRINRARSELRRLMQDDVDFAKRRAAP